MSGGPGPSGGRREAWLSAGAVFLLALAVRIVAARLVSFPVPEDTAYYVDVARNVVAGRGLVSDALWSYGTPPLAVPRAAFEVWLPLPSLLAAVPMTLAGATFAAAQSVSVVAGALVAVLAWRLGADVAAELRLPPGRARTLGLGSGVVAAAYGPFVLHSALPDSTMLFAVLGVAACLLMARLLRAGGDAGGEAGRVGAAAIRPTDRRLLGLGLLLGVAALTRNEAAWLALAWAALAWFAVPGRRAERLRLIVVPGLVAVAAYAPWAVRDWLVFGSPLPGQAVANAFSVSGLDIFAWHDPPTLGRYLAQGPAALARMRLDGFVHNLVTVLLVPAIPVGPLGLLALPATARLRSLRPLLLASLLIFAVATLVFPVATTWGTFLHAAGPVHVLLIVSCLVGLDGLIASVGRWRGWTRPVAWLGPATAAGIGLPILVLTMTGIGALARDTAARYEALGPALARAGAPLDGRTPVISDHPIWLAYATGQPALALPDEPPPSVLDLVGRFGADLLVLSGTHGRWPAVLDAHTPEASCFRELDLSAVPGSPLAGTRAFRIVCR
ncbi:MAG TPA: hypothetical protein VF763_08315 [Candidatus Limnocylindrales bacterium]